MLRKSFSSKNSRTSLLTAVIIAGITAGCVAPGSATDSKNPVDAFLLGAISVSNTVKINSTSPTGSITMNASSANRTFTASATSPSGISIAYSWALNGIAIATTSPGSANISPTMLVPGSNNLVVRATDGATSDSYTWSIRYNTAPTISSPSPSTTKGLSVGSTLVLSAAASDADGDSLTATWTLNGSTSASLVSNGISGGVASATLTGTAALLGSNNITLAISDGDTTASYTFTVRVNYFSDACNNLTQGNFCTYVGWPGFGSGETPTSTKVSFEGIIDFDFDAAGNVYILDGRTFVAWAPLLWVWNRGATNITVLGTTILPGTMKIVLGTGGGGTYTPGTAITAFTLQYATGIAVDRTTGDIYLSSQVNTPGVFKFSAGTSTVTARPVTNYTNRITYKVIGGQGRIYFGDRQTAKVGYVKTSDLSVTYVAGNGTAGFSGDGGVATAAQLNVPVGMAFDANDNLYITDSSGSRVRVVCATTAVGLCSGATRIDASNQIKLDGSGAGAATAGNIYTLAGTGAVAFGADDVSPLNATFYNLSHVEITSAGHILLTDQCRTRIINNSAAPLSYAGVTIAAYQIKTIVGKSSGSCSSATDGVLASSTFNSNNIDPQRTAVSKIGPDGNLWVTESLGVYYYSTYSRLRSVNVTTGLGSTIVGNVYSSFKSTIAADQPASYHPLTAVGSLVSFSNGDMIFGEHSTYNNGLSFVSGTTGLVGPLGSRMVIPTSGMNFTDTGTYILGWASRDPNDNLILTEANASIIGFWNRGTTTLTRYGQAMGSGMYYFLAGLWAVSTYSGDGGSATTATLKTPYYAATDGTDLYIADSGNMCIRKVNSSGTISTLAGQCGTAAAFLDHATATSARFSTTYTFRIDSQGNLIIADYGNQRIRMLNLSGAPVTAYNQTLAAGELKTIAGGGADGTSTGIAATSAAMQVIDLALDANNNIYAADYGWGLIRKITRSGASAGRMDIIAGRRSANYQGGHQKSAADEGGSPTAIDLLYPYSITIDTAGDLYFSTFYGTIKKVKLTP